MSSSFVCVINRLVILDGSLSTQWCVKAAHGKFQEEFLHPPFDGDRKRMTGDLAVRREQLEALFLCLHQQQIGERIEVTGRDIQRPRRIPHVS